MLLRLLSLIIIFSITAEAAVNETEYHKSEDFTDDVKILKRMLKEDPKDLVSLKRLLKIHFVEEDFRSSRRIASKYLSIKKDKEVAYIRIISLANNKMYKKALKEIDEFLNNYKISNREQRLIMLKMALYDKLKETKPLPINAKMINLSEEKILISFYHNGKEILGYDRKMGRYFSYSFSRGKIKLMDKEPDFLTGINAKELLFFSISIDGREALASIKRGENHAKVLMRQYSVHKKTWSQWLFISSMNPGDWNSYGNFTSDASSVIFSSDADKNNGLDIYSTTRGDDGQWSRPRKLANINTPIDEYSLFLHPDGETLYYSSNGMKGMGGFDIYGTRLIRKENEYLTTKSISIKSLNTYRNEHIPLLIARNGKMGFHNLSVANKNYIYRVKNLIVKPRPVSLLEGHVYDKETKEPVKGAEIRIMRIGGQELRGTIRTRTYADGFLGATLRQNSRYIVSISVMDYLYYRKNVNVKAGQKYLKRNFYLKKGRVTKGFSFVANNIYFDIGSAKLKENSYDEIHNIYNFLKRNPKVVIQISGYTDSTGSYEFNLRLSEQRANAIANYLKGKGISRERTHVKGFGYANQAASNLTEEGRKLNRRVEIKVIEVKK